MKIIVGLGNPGFRYRRTRHNIGFRILDVFAKKYGIRLKNKSFQGVYGAGRVFGEEVTLFEPLAYMNLSGPAVHSICSGRMAEPGGLLVISDDFNLPMGVIRIREKGSAGGHNGLQSIIESIGPDFNRLRVGVGDEDMPEDKAKYVLTPFPRESKDLLEKEIERSVECVEVWVRDGLKEAMERYNGASAGRFEG